MLNLGHVSCMFENMSRLSGLCWIDKKHGEGRRTLLLEQFVS